MADFSPLKALLTRYPALLPCREALDQAAEMLIHCFRNGHKLLVCGNGGSAADSQHIVGELMKGFVLPRSLDDQTRRKLIQVNPERAEYLTRHLQGALPALSLIGESALHTAFANDAAPDLCFAQQVLGLGNAGDVLLGISTSGDSANVLYAAHVAHAKSMLVIGLLGRNGGSLLSLTDCALIAPASETYQIQEYHLPMYHALCMTVEQEFFANE
ncbi:MAG: SIS domain-containing protein [Clostridia bacterium]|nr:SIS domain-containing protein [Clostridia bacterium]